MLEKQPQASLKSSSKFNLKCPAGENFRKPLTGQTASSSIVIVIVDVQQSCSFDDVSVRKGVFLKFVTFPVDT
jgi:hypothetical protein